MTPRPADDRGVTVVELLVAIVLSLVVLGVAAGTIVQGLKTQRREVAQVAALNSTRTAFERLTRDLRNANPLHSATATSATMTSTVDGRERTVTYRLAAGRVLVDEGTVDAATGTVLADPQERQLIAGVEPPAGQGMFRWFGPDGVELPSPVDPEDVARITVRLRVPVRERAVPLDLSTDVVVRNREV